MDDARHSLAGARRASVAPAGARGAILAERYRYLLWRGWDATRPRLLWVLLNPSSADAQRDDPTMRRCARFSRAWGYGGMAIANLFALRTPTPRELRSATDPIGDENDDYLAAAAMCAADVVVAWGAGGRYLQRDRAVLALLARPTARALACLGTTGDGSPRHPLYLPSRTRLVPYPP